MNKRGQQEIVGFVLIVVLVVVGLMVFLIMSLRDSPEAVESLEVENMLDALMKLQKQVAKEPLIRTHKAPKPDALSGVHVK